jgi:hypothetical protein
MESEDLAVTIQLVRGSDPGGVRCVLNERQRRGTACVVCGRSEALDTNGRHVGYVAGQSVVVHGYCIGRWQLGEIRRA